MPACPSILLLLWGVTAASSFCPPHPQGRQGMPIRHTITALNVVEKVEVCGFKDCKRAGGGPRLVKTIGEILKEKDMMSEIAVELCDCQGECGYGPNLVVDGNIVNDVKSREDILKALGIQE